MVYQKLSFFIAVLLLALVAIAAPSAPGEYKEALSTNVKDVPLPKCLSDCERAPSRRLTSVCRQICQDVHEGKNAYYQGGS